MADRDTAYRNAERLEGLGHRFKLYRLVHRVTNLNGRTPADLTDEEIDGLHWVENGPDEGFVIILDCRCETYEQQHAPCHYQNRAARRRSR